MKRDQIGESRFEDIVEALRETFDLAEE